MRIPLGNSPTSWGIDFADQPDIEPWDVVFERIAAAGYDWAELGPAGYVPDDPDLVRDRFAGWGLRVAGSFIFEAVHDRAALDVVRTSASQVAGHVAGLGGRYLVIVPRAEGVRAALAGRHGEAPRARGEALEALVEGVDVAAEIAIDHDLEPVLHPHAGSWVEFDDEIDAVLSASAVPELGLCVDTGHSAYAGLDPAGLIRTYAEQVRYIHFKDLDPSVHASVVAEGSGFFEAIERGVFCPLGAGAVDFAEVLDALRVIGYDGPATVEQDRRPRYAGRSVRCCRRKPRLPPFGRGGAHRPGPRCLRGADIA